MLEKTRSRSNLERKIRHTKAKKGKTNEEKVHMDMVAQLGCIICGMPACLHHIRMGMGIGQRNSHFNVLPLCYNHHQGRDGIHTLGTKKWQKIYGGENQLLERVRQKLQKVN